jgi:hypothetical protein
MTKMNDQTTNNSDSEFAAGNRYRVEVGNCAISNYAYTKTAAEARAKLAEILNEWENCGIPECAGENIVIKTINEMHADEDGDYDAMRDEEI